MKDLFLLHKPVADPGFSPGGAPTPKSTIIFQFFAENCMKMKEFGPPGGGRASLAPPLGSANVNTSNRLKYDKLRDIFYIIVEDQRKNWTINGSSQESRLRINRFSG